MAIPVKVKMDKATALNIVYLVAGLSVLVVALVLFWKFRNKIAAKLESNKASAAVIEHNKQNEAISEETGVPVQNISRARSVANNVAKALQVHKNSGWFNYGEDEELAISNLNRLDSEEEAILASKFYTTEATEGRSLTADLQRFLSKSELRQIIFFEILS